MVTTTPLHPVSSSIDRPLQSVKLLSQREDYATCHICIQGDSQRLPAIVLNSKFYSFFRALQDADKTLELLLKLSTRGDQTVLTPLQRGYAIWVYEATAVMSTPPKNQKGRHLSPTLSPADCWIIRDRQPAYRLCTLKVPDLPDAVPGLANGQKLYSLYRRESDAATMLKLGARLSQRGDELVILRSTAGNTIYIYEPGATTLS